MALSPLAAQERIEFIDVEEALKTYEIDFERGRLNTKKIDGVQALKQFVRKALATERFKYRIYTDLYGSELKSLIGGDASYELIRSEVPRLIKEALSYHSHIIDVENVDIEINGDKLFVNFRVLNKLRNFEVETEVTLI